MTNIIKAPIQKIRRKGPNGEYLVKWKEIEQEVVNRLDKLIGLGSEWQLVESFYQCPKSESLSDDTEKEEWFYGTVAVAIISQDTHEMRFFILQRLMPELECWL